MQVEPFIPLTKLVDGVGSQGRITHQGLGGTETTTGDADILLAHVVDALAHVLFTDPCLVKSPDRREALALTHH